MLSFGYDHLIGWLLVCALFVEHPVFAKGIGFVFLVGPPKILHLLGNPVLMKGVNSGIQNVKRFFTLW